MAGETRRQRRDARRAAGAAEPSAARGRFARQSVEAGEAVAVPTPQHELTARRGGPIYGTAGFIGESWAELKKVDWPKRPQVIQGTVVVLVACLIIGLYLYGADRAIQPFVRDVLLRGK